MTRENKELFLKDICTRFPYGIKVQIKYYDDVWKLQAIYTDGTAFVARDIENHIEIYLEDCKPYLFPLSSMTEEQREELYKIGWYLDEDKIYSCFRNYDDVNYKTHNDCFELINWCYKNNFDINGLIPMGLANDATGKNIY